MTTETLSDEPDSIRGLSPPQRVRLGELIDAHRIACDSGRNVTPEQLCAADPELLDALRQSLGWLTTVRAHLRQLETAPLPTKIGEFRVLDQIGVGGSGVVFRCRQESPHRDVAVKVFRATGNAEEQFTPVPA